MATHAAVQEARGQAAGDPSIVVEGLRKSFGKNVAVDGLSFTVHPGEIFGLLGPNGAGSRRRSASWPV